MDSAPCLTPSCLDSRFEGGVECLWSGRMSYGSANKRRRLRLVSPVASFCRSFYPTSIWPTRARADGVWRVCHQRSESHLSGRNDDVHCGRERIARDIGRSNLRGGIAGICRELHANRGGFGIASSFSRTSNHRLRLAKCPMITTRTRAGAGFLALASLFLAVPRRSRLARQKPEAEVANFLPPILQRGTEKQTKRRFQTSQPSTVGLKKSKVCEQ